MKIKNIFKQGAIQATAVADSIAKHQVKTEIGGHKCYRIYCLRRNGKPKGC